jgi:hypothetical protein
MLAIDFKNACNFIGSVHAGKRRKLKQVLSLSARQIMKPLL